MQGSTCCSVTPAEGEQISTINIAIHIRYFSEIVLGIYLLKDAALVPCSVSFRNR